ncbi:MAG: hypothetical protein WKF37_13220, partial [Bryobacteraceae bacterium]
DWQGVTSLRRILQSDGRLLGFWTEDSLAFAAVAVSPGTRSVVSAEGRWFVTFAVGEEARMWPIDGATSLPVPADDNVLLRVSGAAANVSSLDLAGAVLRETAVLFHTDASSAKSAVSFDSSDTQAKRSLVTGLAPGMWEVWRNGWLLDVDGRVAPQAGCLYFEERPGSYFLAAKVDLEWLIAASKERLRDVFCWDGSDQVIQLNIRPAMSTDVTEIAASIGFQGVDLNQIVRAITLCHWSQSCQPSGIKSANSTFKIPVRCQCRCHQAAECKHDMFGSPPSLKRIRNLFFDLTHQPRAGDCNRTTGLDEAGEVVQVVSSVP